MAPYKKYMDNPQYKEMIDNLNKSEQRIRERGSGLLLKCFLCNRLKQIKGKMTFFERKKSFMNHLNRYHLDFLR